MSSGLSYWCERSYVINKVRFAWRKSDNCDIFLHTKCICNISLDILVNAVVVKAIIFTCSGSKLLTLPSLLHYFPEGLIPKRRKNISINLVAKLYTHHFCTVWASSIVNKCHQWQWLLVPSLLPELCRLRTRVFKFLNTRGQTFGFYYTCSLLC